jgi:hypothetical protein
MTLRMIRFLVDAPASQSNDGIRFTPKRHYGNRLPDHPGLNYQPRRMTE